MPQHTLKGLASEMRTKAVVNMKREGMFRNVLKGCFVKAYDFALLAHKRESQEYAFFLAPALRGICEDFIALLYLRRKRTAAQRHQLVGSKAMQQVSDAVSKQAAFFAKHRSFQPVFSLKAPLTLPPGNLPPARNMAREIGLSDLYDFIYAITSDVVHFNPRIIIRNAWGKDEASFEHATLNFGPYYLQFCRIYSLYLFCRFARAFARDLALSKTFRASIAKLENNLRDQLRWPEAVTYEEMNVKGPDDFIRILIRSAHQVSKRRKA